MPVPQQACQLGTIDVRHPDVDECAFENGLRIQIERTLGVASPICTTGVALYAFPCDADGQVAVCDLSDRGLANYLIAQAGVGSQFSCPFVTRTV